MVEKKLTIVFYRREWPRNDWKYQLPETELQALLGQLPAELTPFGVEVEVLQEELSMAIKGYADLLNSVRLRFPAAGLGNLCLGHVIGSSPHADLLEDLRRGVNRVVFAPETVEPEGSDKVICHNCGCGC